jgi:CubicO group peptidase (beta-lactamase class C family)
MLLVHDGRLKYDERLTEIFPEFPAYGRSITIRQLLNHTSGLPDYEALMEKTEEGRTRWSESNQITDSEVLRLLESEQRGRFTAGAHWAYSNSGYVVLGLIAARVSGMSFPDFLQQRIFKPLNMNRTIAYVKGMNTVSNRAYGHSVENGKLIETDQSSTSATLGDGGIYSNLSDLAKWDDALAHQTLLSETEMQTAFIPVRMPEGSLPKWDSGPGDADPVAGKPVAYGFGWFLDPYKSHFRMWHYGETVGFRSAIQRFTADHLTIVVLSNRSDVDAISLSTQFADLLLR